MSQTDYQDIPHYVPQKNEEFSVAIIKPVREMLRDILKTNLKKFIK